MCGFSKSTWVIILAMSAASWIQIMKRNKLCDSKTDLTGKTVIVTGGNSGIGYETALGIAKRNAKVVIACRNELKAQKAVENIRKSTGAVSVEYLIVDFAEMADIKRAADEFMKKEDRLDILINNAGVITWGKTKDGFDKMFGVNHLGYFMLTNLLMPLMRRTSKKSPVRIINVSAAVISSSGKKTGQIDFDNLNPDIYVHDSIPVILSQYANTKLMNVYFTSELDLRLKKEFQGKQQAITTYSLHPGIVYSNIAQEYTNENGILHKILRKIILVLLAQPESHGAQTSICCAVEEGVEEHSGGYFSNLQLVEAAKDVLDPEIGRKLWVVSEELTGLRWRN